MPFSNPLVPVQVRAGAPIWKEVMNFCSLAGHADSRFEIPLGLRRVPAGWLPCRCAVLPLVVGELLNICAVKTHYEDLAVWLWRIRIYVLVLETHPR